MPYINEGVADLEALYYDPTRPSDFEALSGRSPTVINVCVFQKN